MNHIEKLKSFINSCRTPFHAVKTVEETLDKHGFIKLSNLSKWDLKKGGSYYVVISDATIIAFKIGKNVDNPGFKAVVSHNDSPTFKIKPNYIIKTAKCSKLNTEPYGGALFATWFDRPLGIAGRVLVKNGDEINTLLVDLDKKNVIIPSLAIHLDRTANSNATYNPQIDMLPIMGEENADFMPLIEDKLNIKKEDILDHDLYLYNCQELALTGMNDEFVSSPKLDDLECAYSSLEAFLASNNDLDVNICGIFDNEEVGSLSNHGIRSSVFINTIDRIINTFNFDRHICLNKSFLVSADNAHAVHPAHPEKSDPTNCVFMNKGIVIKYNSQLSYTTDSISASIFKTILNKAHVDYQVYTNRSDLRGGSTLGPATIDKFSVPSIDIGLAQLAMHSSFETAGTKDLEDLIKGLESFYNSTICYEDNKIIIK